MGILSINFILAAHLVTGWSEVFLLSILFISDKLLHSSDVTWGNVSYIDTAPCHKWDFFPVFLFKGSFQKCVYKLLSDEPINQKPQTFLIFFHSHFSASCRSLDAWEREEREQRTEVHVWEKMTIKEQRPCLLGLCVGRWKSWKVRAQSRLLPAPHSVSLNNTKARSKTNTEREREREKIIAGNKVKCYTCVHFSTNHKIKQL